MGSKGRDKGRRKPPADAAGARPPWIDDDAMSAIRKGRVDALVFSGDAGNQVFTLSGSENAYRLFVESMNEGAATVAADGTILYCNRSLANLAGLPLERALGGNVHALLPPEELGIFDAAFEMAQRDAAKVELHIAKPDGRVPVLISLRSFSEFGARATCMVVTDLTEQKRHEELVSTGELARTILEQSAQAIAVCDSNGRVILASKVLHQLCQRNPILQQFDELLPLQLQVDGVISEGFSVAKVLAGRSFRSVEVALVRPGGEPRLFLLTANSLALPSSEASGCVVTLFDIEERKRSEEALRKSERLAATGRLAAVIAHEINNPLESVTNLLYLIHCDKSLSPELAQYVHVAEAELSRVAHITKQTLAFHRESSEPAALEVSTLIESVAYLFASQLQAKEVELLRDIRYYGEVHGYPSELRQVLANFLSNALEACGSRGRVWLRVRRSVERKPPHREGLRIIVADNGPGIARHDLHRIFEPFFTTKGEKGTGLGLWVSQGIVQKHAGSIQVWSSIGPKRRGTVFSVFLPDMPKVRSIDWRSERSASDQQRQARVG